jgi:hypothetical protein
MPDIKTQLRAYFDETAERVTEEDVRIRASTDWGVPIPSPRFRPRPLAAGAIGFGLAMTLLGLVLVVDRVFGTGIPDVGSNGGSVLTPTGEKGSFWLFIPVVFGLGLLATGIISARRHNGDMRERGEDMHTIEKTETVEAPLNNEILTLKKRNRRLGWLAGILAVAVVGGGIWFAVDQASGDGLPSEVSAVLDDYTDAWAAYDGAAAAALTTTDFTLVGSNDEVYPRLVLPGFIAEMKALDFRVEPQERTVIGDGPYYVTQTARVHSYNSPVAGDPGASVFTIVEEDGTWKIQQHLWRGEL